MAVMQWATARWQAPKDTSEPDVSDRQAQPLDPGAETVVAVSALASFQQITQQLDGKVNTLIGVHLALVAVVANRSGAVLQSFSSDGADWLLLGASATVLVAAAVTGYLIFSAFRPRVARYTKYNHWALPGSSGARPPGSPTASELAAEAWLAAYAVGDIAAAKTRCVRRASVSLVVTVGLTLAWLALLP